MSEVLIAIILGSVGGAVSYFHKIADGRFNFRMLAISMFVSAFSGYLCFELASIYYPKLSRVISGLGGFWGVESINFITRIIRVLSRTSQATATKNTDCIDSEKSRFDDNP